MVCSVIGDFPLSDVLAFCLAALLFSCLGTFAFSVGSSLGRLMFSSWIGHSVLLKSFRLDDVICLPIWMVSNITRGYPSGSKMLFEDLTLKTLFATKGYPLVMCPPSCPRGLLLTSCLHCIASWLVGIRFRCPLRGYLVQGPVAVSLPPVVILVLGPDGIYFPPPGFSHWSGVIEAWKPHRLDTLKIFIYFKCFFCFLSSHDCNSLSALSSNSFTLSQSKAI